MAETKYGKCILREPHAPAPSVSGEEVKETPKNFLRVNSRLLSGIDCDFQFVVITPANVGPAPGPEHETNKHDVDEYLFMIGGDPENMVDLGAEIELCLGEGQDQEKHIINTASVVYIPKGLAHLPMTFKRVDRPFIFGHLLLASDYNQTRV